MSMSMKKLTMAESTMHVVGKNMFPMYFVYRLVTKILSQ